MDETLEVTLDKVRETGLAYLISNGKEEVWVAKSLCTEITFENPTTLKCCIPSWLAEKYDFS